MPVRPFVLLLIALAALPAAAQVYKWTGPDGRTHYGDRPPDDAKLKDVKVGLQSHAGPAQVDNWTEVIGADFMRYAFAGGLLVAVAASLLGYFVVIRRQAFAAHALAHIGFPGATGAVLIGVPVTLGLAVFCVICGAIVLRHLPRSM